MKTMESGGEFVAEDNLSFPLVMVIIVLPAVPDNTPTPFVFSTRASNIKAPE